MARVHVVDDPARQFAQLIAQTCGRGDLLALSGGSTALRLLDTLATSLPQGVAVAQVDERLVAPGSPWSNWTHIERALAGLPSTLLPMVDESALDAADRRALEGHDEGHLAALAARLAHSYERRIAAIRPWRLVHLGLGPDGHTASLFPDSPGLRASGTTTVNVDPSGANPFMRISLTVEAIRQFELQVVVAIGRSKAPVVAAALAGQDLPINLVVRDDTIWLLDDEAAGELDPQSIDTLGDGDAPR